MTTRTELDSKIVQTHCTEWRCPHNSYEPHYTFYALCDDGSMWSKTVSWNRGDEAPWAQFHPPHRAPEVKAPASATNTLRFSEVTEPGAYWYRWPNNPWYPCIVSFRGGHLSTSFDGGMSWSSDSYDELEALEEREFVGPLPEPEVGA